MSHRRVVLVVVLVYGVTWVVATMTVRRPLGVAWMTYATRAFVHPSDRDAENAVDEAAGRDLALEVDAIVPVLPAVVLIKSELTGTFKSGAVNRYTVGNWCLVVVYGTGARILKAWPLSITPEPG